MRTLLIIFVLMSWSSLLTQAQTAPFNLQLEPFNIDNLGGLQSYAFGESDGKWLIIGGRLDGLHRRQPFATFDIAGHNTNLLVVDPLSRQIWSAALTELAAPLREQLSSTNMAFFQDGDMLYLAGGYGYSPSLGDHTTYGYLCAIHVPKVIQAIIQKEPFAAHIRQLPDLGFTVTGGRLGKIKDTYYLVGGQNFQGRYNPMGPAHGPGFFQEYTNAIRRFNIYDDGNKITIKHQIPWVDTAHLHRRDFNVVPQIMPDGQEGLTAFSGVFRSDADLPYLNCVNIDSNGYRVVPNFQQYYNHYHTAVLPLFDRQKKEMHTVFFGGIAQFYDSLGLLVQDNNVPFVKTIARVTRTADHGMSEYKLPIEMPYFLGAGAEFIPAYNASRYSNGVLKLNDLKDSSVIGYLYGGIRSEAPNIFWINNGTQSIAYTGIFQIRLLKNKSTATHQLNAQSKSSLQVMAVPNPNSGQFKVRFNLNQPTPVSISIRDLSGKVLTQTTLQDLPLGQHEYPIMHDAIKRRGVCVLNVETSYEKSVLKIIIEP